MKTSIITVAAAAIFSTAIVIAWFPASSSPVIEPGPPTSKPGKHLKPFSSEAELKKFFKSIVRKRKSGGGGGGTGNGNDAENAIVMASGASFDLAASGKGPAQESITNTQHAGVDEGGIVKLHGDHLVVLRRGRLFTIALGDSSLTPISAVDAFGADIDPDDTWYDELLISGDNIVVVGYSYDRGGTELGLFKISRDGKLKYRSTYHLRSNDYYSSRNYSSRLIGNKLIFYSPLYLDWDQKNVLDNFPALRKWHKGADASEFRRIVPAERIYRIDQVPADQELALHTVTTCDLSNAEMTCGAQSVLGPSGNVFYVSPKSVYVWASDWDWDNTNKRDRSILFKMSLEGSEPSAIRVSGSPVDQFSFLEDENGQVNVLVRADSAGDGMWRAEVSEGETALLRLSANSFGDGNSVAPISDYISLPKPDGYAFQNRFVGDYLLYGSGNGWGQPQDKDEKILYAVNWKTGSLSTIALSHSVDRLDALGNDGIVVGTHEKDLLFTSLRLDRMPRVIDTYRMQNASQGETRSQGFFYKPDGADSGTLGLPVTSAGRPGYKQLKEGSASILFLRNRSLQFSELGSLTSAADGAEQNDDCKASCVDWYGNARPIFARGRIFALLGYELVEGSVNSNHIEQVRRVDFTPKQARAAR